MFPTFSKIYIFLRDHIFSTILGFVVFMHFGAFFAETGFEGLVYLDIYVIFPLFILLIATKLIKRKK